MGNTASTKYINFEDMQSAIANKEYIIINTLPETCQACLIAGTLNMKNEEEILNSYLKTNKTIRIIVYGMNSQDPSVQKKYDQLTALGFFRVFIYNGGMFEWLLLQDIYGKELLLTTTVERDILKFKGYQQFNLRLLN
jgi:hypothetical protein